MNLDDFIRPKPEKEAPKKQEAGIPWDAVVLCQVCGEDVEEQTLFIQQKLLVWKCSEGHESVIEGYQTF